MKHFSPETNRIPPPQIEDYTDAPFYSLLKKVPVELIGRHLSHIEKEALDDNEATTYIEEVLQKRVEATTETVISDRELSERIKDQKEAIFKQIETSVFRDTDNFLGAGMTAKVKFFEIEDTGSGESLPIAVKYLLTPTKMTLSASSEHDMLAEVERIKQVEELERDAHLKHISVPHPYFHHQNTEIQCYGMELIDGFDLSYDLTKMPEGNDKDIIVEKLSALDLAEVENEIVTFYKIMHTYCLHGDMKPANMMLDKNGKFYIIDFGQSRLNNDISDKAQDQLYTLREDEIKSSITSVRRVINAAKHIVASR